LGVTGRSPSTDGWSTRSRARSRGRSWIAARSTHRPRRERPRYFRVMPAPILPKDEVLERLLNKFRERGYEGASLAGLSAATGVMKSSLYHHFPGGKVDMAEQVLAYLEARLVADVYSPLGSSQSPAKKLGAMLDAIDAFYEGGRKACLYE